MFENQKPNIFLASVKLCVSILFNVSASNAKIMMYKTWPKKKKNHYFFPIYTNIHEQILKKEQDLCHYLEEQKRAFQK